MPAGFGLHPYLRCEDGAVLDMDCTQRIDLDDALLFAGLLPLTSSDNFSQGCRLTGAWDAVFGGWQGSARLKHDAWALEITADPIFGNLILYRSAQGAFVCLEPVSHVPDAINHPDLPQALGMRVLQSGETIAGAVTITPTLWLN